MSCIYADRPYTGRIPTCDAGYFNCPNNPICEGYAEYKTPTNADRIRGMSDEELAEWIYNRIRITLERAGFSIDEDIPNEDVVKSTLDWLKQPVKEEHYETD